MLESAGPSFREELARQLGQRGGARLWVPAARPFDEVWAPNADVRGPRDLPVLIVAGSDLAALEREVGSLTKEARDGQFLVEQPVALTAGGPGGEPAQAADCTVAILNQGTPGFLVDTRGSIYISLLRSCTGWPSGVWIDPPRRTAPDGSNFELEHWDHVYEHALVAGPGDWRDNDCAWEALSFNTPMVAVVEDPHDGNLPATGSLLELNGPGRQVVLSVLKRSGHPLAKGETGGFEESDMDDESDFDASQDEAGLQDEAGADDGYDNGGALTGGTIDLTARLYESAGRAASATLSAGLSWRIEQAWAANLLEEAGEQLDCENGPHPPVPAGRNADSAPSAPAAQERKCVRRPSADEGAVVGAGAAHLQPVLVA